MTYIEALSELRQIVSRPGVPPAMLRSAARLAGRIDLCLVTAQDDTAGTLSIGKNVRLEPSDGFLKYLSAVRAKEWQHALALERELYDVAATPDRDRGMPIMPQRDQSPNAAAR